jgi:hypothetical protein
MPVPRKLLRSALVDLHHDETITNDKWLTLEAIRKLIYTRFDFDAAIDFTVSESILMLQLTSLLVNRRKQQMKLDHWGKISQGNHTIVRSRMMELRRKDFVNVAKKNSEREPVNAVFLLDGSISEPAARRINGACLQEHPGIRRVSCGIQ